MQKKLEIQASSLEEATNVAVSKLHVSEDKLFLNEIGENQYEALLDVSLALEGRKFLDGILKGIGITEYNIEVRTVGAEEELHYVIDSNENVFGSYTDSDIYQVDSDIRSNNPFIFTLFSNGRCGVKKCKPIYSDQKIRIWNDWG